MVILSCVVAFSIAYVIDGIEMNDMGSKLIQALPQEFLSQVSRLFPKDFITQDPDDLEIFGKDWTKVFPSRAAAIVFPSSTEDISKFLKLASEFKVSVVPSGGRTGLAGGAVAFRGEVVLSLTRMNQIGSVDLLAQTLRVQAGVLTEAVHLHCEPHGLTWPIDFAAKGSSQVGGNIATNAGGVKVIRYGLTRQWVLGLQVVTMEGKILELNGALEKNNTGIDLRQIFIGSEGTLGVISEATLKLTKLLGVTEVFFFAVSDIDSVLQLFQKVRQSPFPIVAFEFLTRNCLEKVLELRNLNSPFSKFYPIYVLIELEQSQSENTKVILDQWLEKLFQDEVVLDGTLAQNGSEAKELWSLREGITEALSHQGFVHKNDIALPISNLKQFISEMFLIFKERKVDLEVYLFGHIGDGNLHVNTLKPTNMSQDNFIQICHQTDLALFELVQRFQGSISAEHGIGLLKKASLKYSRTPEELVFMKGIKKIFDPRGLLNPGKIFDE